MSLFYMLIGVPGSGKSTWSNNFDVPGNTIVVSTDNIIQSIGHLHGMTYDEVFDPISYSFAEKISFKVAEYGVKNRKHIIWDQTNLTKKSRKRKLDLIPRDEYYRVAVYFNIPDDLDKRLAFRLGKTIPWNVMSSMINSREEPDLDEGFDEIMFMDSNTGLLMKRIVKDMKVG